MRHGVAENDHLDCGGIHGAPGESLAVERFWRNATTGATKKAVMRTDLRGTIAFL
jgi:hypothetical protein